MAKNSKRKSRASDNDADHVPSSVPVKKPKEETEQLLSNAVAVAVELPAAVDGDSPARSSGRKSVSKKEEALVEDEEESKFVGDPVPNDEARRRWPHRYIAKKQLLIVQKFQRAPKEFIQAKKHYTEALIDGRVHFKLFEDCYVQAGEGEDNTYAELLKCLKEAKDTVIQACSNLIDDKRIFLSEIKDDNPLDCLVEKLKIVRVPLDVDVATKRDMLSNGNYYYDMLYSVPFSSYQKLPTDTYNEGDGNESDSTVSSESDSNLTGIKDSKVNEVKGTEMRMLDLYSGCGAMSTGLCLGANMANVNLVTRWAVDLNKYACESLKLNHPETEVRNETADDFLLLLKEWEKLCSHEDDDDDLGEEVFEVEKILSICYGDPKKSRSVGCTSRSVGKNYGPEEDTWEPIDGLGDCQEKIKKFVVDGFKSKLLPLPGDVDVICGGPPCQGISGFNRFRKKDDPLSDEKINSL
ncbi:putative DNA (cytosine-5-)-methyltransferase [Helianthus annuus]|nr:putative DNA (cytosine-5-)-methyltransferase [Helianthus annuus]